MRVTLKALGAVGAMFLLAACGGSGGSGGNATSTAADAACQGSGCKPGAQEPAPLTCGGTNATACPQGYRCVADPAANCDLAADASCSGTCVLGEKLPGCNNGEPCPDGYVCTADANGVCADGTADCTSTCRPKAMGQCTSDAECPQLKVACSVCTDGTVSCPTSTCDNGQCNVNFQPCVEPPPPSGCATLQCAAGSHCVEDLMCAVDANGVPCAAKCVPDEPPPTQCGGIAGTPCPPGQECVDDPSDMCDAATGADCPGVCQTVNSGECAADTDCASPAICSICADGSTSCARAFCDHGKCNVSLSTCAPPVSCGSDGCKPGSSCVDDPNDTCDPDMGGANCPGICVPDKPPFPCNADSDCPPGYACAPDPTTGCAPDASGMCTATCVPVQPPPPPPPPQCTVDGDCVTVLGPCTPCPDGTYACPRAVCKEGMCAGWIDACVNPGFCGGIAGFACPPGSTCVDNPNDDCDPKNGGADCGGICVREEQPPSCGGLAGAACPSGYTCVDDPKDNCDPANGADCPGICEPAPSPKCVTDADCPAIGAPCRMCADGTAACPRSYCANGVCAADFKTCGPGS